MKKFLRAFKTQAEYLAYSASTEFELDNVCSCREGDLVYYNSEECGGYVPPVPPTKYDITAKFYVTDTTKQTRIGYYTNKTGVTEIEIDGVKQEGVNGLHTFDTTGEHIVKYKLVNPTVIADGNFFNCTELTSIDIPNSITTLEYSALRDCESLKTITIPNSVTTISSSVFSNSGLESCVIPNSITKINSYVFYQCRSLTSITIPNSVVSIDKSAFNGCESLTSVTIPDTVTSIGDDTFGYCRSLTSATIGSGVTSIGSKAFGSCTSLTSIDIPSGVTSISSQTFMYCSSLTSVTIPSGVTSIGTQAFSSCSGLTSVTVNAVTPPTLGNYAFGGTNNCPIYVPCESVDAYKAAANWSTYASRIQAIPGSCP